MQKIIGSLLVMVALIAVLAMQNSVTIKGIVTDPQGKPLAGVTVSEKSEGKGTTTDSNGKFSITVSAGTGTLVFQLVGFSTLEYLYNTEENVTIVLQPQPAELKKVIVTAHSVTERRTEIRSKNSLKRNNSKVSAQVRGHAPGVMVHREHESSLRVRRTLSSPSSSDRSVRQPKHESDSSIDEAFNTEDYDAIVENRFVRSTDQPLSTFSIDVDGAAYSNIRRFLKNGTLPPAGSVRIEEMINYFSYNYSAPTSEVPFSIHTEAAACPWNQEHRLIMVGLQGKKIPTDQLPPSSLVFLIDVSGSMDVPNKLPLVQQSMTLLADQLREQDRVSIVVYAGSAGTVLPATSGANKIAIKEAIDELRAGGSTAGGEGIRLAYSLARKQFIKGGNNRVILCTDGDFNVGVSSDAELERLIEEERKSGVFLTVLGYGMGNYKDNKMQKLANKGNGNHAYIDDISEARKVLVSEFGGTLFTIAKDVKLQIEFNPAKVQGYRLIGYENRMLASEDFNDDQKDAGELGSGHSVTALYEVIPVGVKSNWFTTVDPLKYQQTPAGNGNSGEWMTIKFRYKEPDGEKSKLIVHTVDDQSFKGTQYNISFVAAVAQFGMLLRNSAFKQQSSFDNVLRLANSWTNADPGGYRREFKQLVQLASGLVARMKIKDPGLASK